MHDFYEVKLNLNLVQVLQNLGGEFMDIKLAQLFLRKIIDSDPVALAF